MRWGGRVALSLVLALAVVYGTAWATTDRFGASRAMVWLEADTGDIHRFPSRVIPAGNDVLELPPGKPLDLSTVWPDGDPEAFLENTSTAAFLVVQDGAIRHEGYFNDARPQELRTSFSTAKSVVSTLVGLAIADGSIGSVDDPISDYIPELIERDARFSDIERATGMSLSGYLSERLWQPMGAEVDASWSLDSEESGFEKMESGLNAVARDYARFGLLFANAGRANGEQVVDEEWVRQATSPDDASGPADFYAFHWWTGRSNGESLPEGHFMAVGNFGQFVYVAPDRDLVIVRLGDDWGTEDWPGLLAEIASRL